MEKKGAGGYGETRGSGDTGLRKFSRVVVGGLQVNIVSVMSLVSEVSRTLEKSSFLVICIGHYALV